ncbi:MAG TPA: alanine racemase [Ilumatobacteraceae bacterium]|nr:alanine racemase [Ilumatobacteraceae bacterium]
MTVRLTVQREAWQAHVRATAQAYGPGLIPVVKGNGYGFGRARLLPFAAELADTLGVGSAHELADVPAALAPVVLTPTLEPPQHARAIFTVDHPAHVDALAGRDNGVVLKLASSMRRYGVDPDGVAALATQIQRAGLRLHAYGLHLPLAGDDNARLAEIEAWLPHLSPDVPLWLSHLTPESFRELQARHPARTLGIRVGTRLWMGIPKGDFLHLSADVLHTRPVRAAERVGYTLAPVPCDGTLVAVGAGSAHGVAPLDHTDPARRSPFHFARERLTLAEPPHMHTSLVVVPTGHPVPQVGDRVDVQRPLIYTNVDEVEWR